MKNCPKGDGEVVEKRHCDSPTCTWFVCATHQITFDAVHPSRQMHWNGRR